MKPAECRYPIARCVIAASMLAVSARAQSSNAAPTAAIDDVTDEASRAFWKGKELHDEGQFAQALDQFVRAYTLTKDPDLLYDIAQTQRALGECEKALGSYAEFLRAVPDSSLAPLARIHVVRLRTNCRPVAREPRQGTVSPAGSGAPVATATPRPRPLQSTPQRIETSGDPSASSTRTWILLTLSGAVVTEGAAAGLEIWNHNRYEQWSSADRNLARGLAPGESPSDWQNRQRANDMLGRSIRKVDHEVIFVSLSGAALATTSAFLYLWPSKTSSRRSNSATRTMAVAAQPIVWDRHSASLSLSGSF